MEIKQEILRLEKIWKRVFMNYITKLPKLKRKDFILVIKNQYSGMIHIKIVKKVQTTKEVW